MNRHIHTEYIEPRIDILSIHCKGRFLEGSDGWGDGTIPEEWHDIT